MTVPPLRTARLRLEPLDPERDAADLITLWADPRFSEFEISPPPADVEQVRERFDWVALMPPGLGGWALRPPDRSELVGRVSLRQWRHAPDGPPELGWHLKPAYWGQGLASEAIRAVLRYAWTDLGLGPVIALVHVDNQRSLAVVRRLGGRPTETGQWYGAGHDFVRFEIDPPRVRPARADEADALLALWTDGSRRRREAGPGGEPSPELVGVWRGLIEDYLGDPGSAVLVAERGGALSSMAIAAPGRADDGDSGDLMPGVVHVSMVATRAADLGLGAAATLLRRQLEWARERGHEQARLWVHADNVRARGLYAGLGFVASGRSKSDSEGAPLVLLVCPLGPSRPAAPVG